MLDILDTWIIVHKTPKITYTMWQTEMLHNYLIVYENV